NLGITFVAAERRAVSETIRVPGRFERTARAYHDHHSRAAGRVTTALDVLDRVSARDVLFTVDSPAWSAAQVEIRAARLEQVDAQAELDVVAAKRAEAIATAELPSRSLAPLDARLAAHRLHVEALREVLKVWEAREAELLAAIRDGAGLA